MTMDLGRIARLIGAVAVVGSMTLAGDLLGRASIASGHSGFGWNGQSVAGGVRPSDNIHTGCWQAGSASPPLSLLTAWSYWETNATTYSFIWGGNCTGNANDMRFDNNTCNSQWNGLYTCKTYDGSGQCRDATVSLSFCPQNASAPAVWCHEMGHSLGLQHRASSSSSCMNVVTTTTPVSVTGHELDHVAQEKDNPS